MLNLIFRKVCCRQHVRMSIEVIGGKKNWGGQLVEGSVLEFAWHPMPRLIPKQTHHSTCLESKSRWGLIPPLISSRAASGWPSKQQLLILWPLVLPPISLRDYVKNDSQNKDAVMLHTIMYALMCSYSWLKSMKVIKEYLCSLFQRGTESGGNRGQLVPRSFYIHQVGGALPSTKELNSSIWDAMLGSCSSSTSLETVAGIWTLAYTNVAQGVPKFVHKAISC